MKRILLVKTSSLGDVIHNLTVVNDILAHFPQAKIDWVVEESFADILKLHPAIQRIIPVAIRRWRKQLLCRNTWAEITAFKRAVSMKEYDCIIDSQGLIKSAILTKFARGTSFGLGRDSAREPLASTCYDKTYRVARHQHAVIRNRQLVALALGYEKPNDAPDYGITANPDAHHDIVNPYIIGLHGTSRDSKLWPVSHWIALGKALANRKLQLVLPWASEAELQRAKEIARALNNASILPKSSIAQLATIIQQAQVAIGVDTGLSHLAVALNVPTIAIYTDTDSALTGVMGGDRAAAINLGGIAQIPAVDSVLQALEKISTSQ
ncbi:MAG: lipopolysaccharide heptosyltransferase I [Methylophilaceae bacterium]